MPASLAGGGRDGVDVVVDAPEEGEEVVYRHPAARHSRIACDDASKLSSSEITPAPLRLLLPLLLLRHDESKGSVRAVKSVARRCACA
jgi:hypothetical protein